MTVKKIDLLTDEQYSRYKPLIPAIRNLWWWLQSPYDGFTKWINIVINNVVANGYCDETGGIRPFVVFELDVSDSKFWYKPEKLIGTKFEYGKYTWTILDAEQGELYALCDEVITKRCFDPESNDWNKSELKQWLETEGLKLITN